MKIFQFFKRKSKPIKLFIEIDAQNKLVRISDQAKNDHLGATIFYGCLENNLIPEIIAEGITQVTYGKVQCVGKYTIPEFQKFSYE